MKEEGVFCAYKLGTHLHKNMWRYAPEEYLPKWEGRRCGPRPSPWTGEPGVLYYHPVLKLAVVGRKIGSGNVSFLRVCKMCQVGTRSLKEPFCTRHGGRSQPRSKCISKNCYNKSRRKGRLCDSCFASKFSPPKMCSECGRAPEKEGSSNGMCAACDEWLIIKKLLQLPDKLI